jgi:hypothetical protein
VLFAFLFIAFDGQWFTRFVRMCACACVHFRYLSYPVGTPVDLERLMEF